MSNPFAPAPIEMFPPGEKTNALKTQFAIALLRNPDAAFKAGLDVFGAETGKALYIAQNWVNDEYVNAEQVRLVQEKGERSFLPSKEEYAREVWKLAMAERTPGEDKRHLLSLYGDIMGYKQQAEKSGLNLTVNNNRVMIVKDHGTDDEWEHRAQSQQHQLAQGAIDVHARTVA